MAELREKALDAVEEAAAQSEAGQAVAKTKALAFALAYLSNHAPERWPFDAFWKEATKPPVAGAGASAFGRHQSITNAINGIYVQIGVDRRR